MLLQVLKKVREEVWRSRSTLLCRAKRIRISLNGGKENEREIEALQFQL
jgi:hypothetical protein